MVWYGDIAYDLDKRKQSKYRCCCVSRSTSLLSSEGEMFGTAKSSAAVHAGVACSTEGDQILARIITGVATKLFVVDLKVGHCAARLASPAIAM